MNFGSKIAIAVGAGAICTLTGGLAAPFLAVGLSGGMIATSIAAGAVGVIGSKSLQRLGMEDVILERKKN